MFKKEVNQEKVEAKLLALSLVYEKEESCRQQLLQRISYTPEEMEAVLEILSGDPEFRDWVKSVIPLMQCREDNGNAIYALIDEIKKSTGEIHERDKKMFEMAKRHFKERHEQATAQIPNLVKKLKQTEGAGNKIKVALQSIPENIKESIETTKRQNRELRELRRSGGKKSKTPEPSDEIVILGLRIKINPSSTSSISLKSLNS
jgi:seryl-tRNA synthetase